MKWKADIAMMGVQKDSEDVDPVLETLTPALSLWNNYHYFLKHLNYCLFWYIATYSSVSLVNKIAKH